MPGVSSTRRPLGSSTSWRCVVVWRPRASSSRIACVAISGRARQRIDEARLADAGAAEQHRRLARGEAFVQAPQVPRPVTAETTCTGTPSATPLDLGLVRVAVLAQVRLGQHHHRGGAALPGGGQVALDAARVEVGVQRRDQEGHVDVGGDHLRRAATADRLAHEGAAARQQVVDGGAGLRGANRGGHPIAGHRIGAGFGLMREAPRKLGGRFAHRGRQHVEAALLHDDTRGLEATRGVGLELLLERIAPAVAVEQERKSFGRQAMGAPAEEILIVRKACSVTAR